VAVVAHAASGAPFYTSATIPLKPVVMPCKTQLAFIALIVVLGSMQMLASCGQKGDLYLPGDVPEERR
jgi:hypothetical protein